MKRMPAFTFKCYGCERTAVVQSVPVVGANPNGDPRISNRNENRATQALLRLAGAGWLMAYDRKRGSGRFCPECLKKKIAQGWKCPAGQR